MKQITKNIIIETGYDGCNVGMVTTEEGIVMIDTPFFPADSAQWREELDKRGQVRFLINTDQHPDHFWGNFFFPTTIIAHKTARELMAMIPSFAAIEMVKNRAPETLPLMEGYKTRLPNITFDVGMNIFLGDLSFELIRLPGHASGVIGVHIPEERLVFASDCIFHKSKTYLHHATPDEWFDSLDKLSQLDVDIIVPGHGDDICSKAYIAEQRSIIEQWVELVKSAMKQRLSEEEAKEQIKCLDPYPLPRVAPYTEPELNKVITSRLYQVYSQENKS